MSPTSYQTALPRDMFIQFLAFKEMMVPGAGIEPARAKKLTGF
jgi:hypothetical protein